MTRDPWERIVAPSSKGAGGLYESNYLKANSPQGDRGLWIKHNLLKPAPGHPAAERGGGARGEFWVVLFERGCPPVVARRDVAWADLELAADGIGIAAGPIALTPVEAHGRIADIAWRLSIEPDPVLGAPLHHLPYDWMYRAGFPKKKALSPAPQLRFDGVVEVAGRRWKIDRWVGLRGHNWGREHALAYAYGNCNLWDGPTPAGATVDGFTVKVKLGPVRSPWISMVVGRLTDSGGPVDLAWNQPRRWLRTGQVIFPVHDKRGAWRFEPGDGSLLEMEADEGWAGLRYAHPDGRESYCYNTKFARVRWVVPGWGERTSRSGELELLTPEPLPDLPLHPTREWVPGRSDYRST